MIGDSYSGKLTAIILGLATTNVALARDDLQGVVAIPLISEACELHVWPSKGLRSVLTGWVHGGIVDGAVTHREGYDAILVDPIDMDAQRAILSSANLPVLFGLSNYHLVVHTGPLDRNGMADKLARATSSRSSCYAEFIADNVFLQQDFVNGSAISTLFRYRFYGASHTPEQSFATWVKAGLKSFPPKTPADSETATEEVRAAYRKNISSFQEQWRNAGKSKAR
jgi:hypothetical protein